jgi:DNA-binding PadR family transcriptional regulator
MDIQANLPLTEPTYLIMLSLAPGEKHGYAILKDVQALSENRVVLSTGTLYGAIKRLLELQWIARMDESGSNDSGHARKAYVLTSIGRQILEAETDRLRKLVAIARLRDVREPA